MRMLLFVVPFVVAGTVLIVWLENQPKNAKAANHLALRTKDIPPKEPIVEELPPPKPKCRLRLELFTKMRVGRKDARITVCNDGNTPVTLVHPGDGSGSGWRTPQIRWTFFPLDSEEDDPVPIHWSGMKTCGLYNNLRPDEVFTLQPGESKMLRNSYNGFPRNIMPGKYRVVVHYKNDPNFKWSPNSSHNFFTMQRVRKSTPVDLESNEQIIELFK